MDLRPLCEATGLAPSAALARASAHARRAHATHGGAGWRAEDLVGCGCMELLLESWLSGSNAPLAALGDEEGASVAPGLPPVIDAHVHVFPDPIFARLWAWFERYGWPVRYQLAAERVAPFLLERGLRAVVVLHYAHRPGLARELNAFVAALARADSRIIPLATVLPGEPDVERIIEDAVGLGLRGIKLHCHVQGFAVDGPEAEPVWSAAEARGLPVVVHAGREPKSPAYRVDTHAVCSAERTEAVLRAHPRLKLCVPHFGADEVDAYGRLLERYDNLYLDTTMLLAGFFPAPAPWHIVRARPDRVLFGTDFPNLPFAWDRELGQVTAAGLTDETLARVLGGTALELYGLRLDPRDDAC